MACGSSPQVEVEEREMTCDELADFLLSNKSQEHRVIRLVLNEHGEHPNTRSIFTYCCELLLHLTSSVAMRNGKTTYGEITERELQTAAEALSLLGITTSITPAQHEEGAPMITNMFDLSW